MKLTLLELTQIILSDMDSDEVNSISDTDEAQQVAKILKETYLDIYSRSNLPEHYSLFELEASGDTNLPTVMYLPSNVSELLWVKYDNTDTDTQSPYILPVEYQDMDTFLNIMHSLNSDEDNVETHTISINSSSIDLLWTNDKFPQFYTTFDDYTILFDSYKSDVDTTLQKNKTSCYGQIEPVFTLSDSFVPDLDSKQFNLLLQEAKSQAFVDLKQVTNEKAEQRARKGWLTLQRKKSAFPLDYYIELPNYSRKG